MKTEKILEIKNKLGSLEEKVLSLINDKYVNPREILNILLKEKHYAYTTIMTVMDKLFKKGYLKRIKKGKTFYYKKITNFNQLINRNNFSIVEYLINYFGRLGLLRIYLSIILFKPFILFFLNRSQLILLKILFYFFISILSINMLINAYLNGFFEYILSIFQNPQFIINNFKFSIFYLFEIIPLNNIILFLLSLYMFKKFTQLENYKLKI